jgi:imidazolonepropionase-like amidohydrolase
MAGQMTRMSRASASGSSRFLRLFVPAAVALAAIGAIRLAAQNERPGGYPTAVPGGFSEPGPDRGASEGNGPFSRLVIRGATVIDGTGAPPQSPVDIVIERNRIVELRSVGYPNLPIRPEHRPAKGDYEIDASGMFVLPGFIDLHGHTRPGIPAEYMYKLWLAHGITTTRDPASHNGLNWTLRERERSARNEIVAPRIVAYASTNPAYVRLEKEWTGGPLNTAKAARAYVGWVKQQGMDGLKIFGFDPEVMAGLMGEVKKLGLGTAAHLPQTHVSRLDAVDAARLGIDSVEHWYGLPEALLEDGVIQPFPATYDYSNEQHRFGEAGRLWLQAPGPGTERWTGVMTELLEHGVALDPTFTTYEASRDLMRAMRAEWHDTYTLPVVWQTYQPNRRAHGAYFFYWTTADEIAWKANYHRWMAFVNEYKNRGGRVGVGTDSGYIFGLYGFSYVRELEMLQEAGFAPLEVVRAATLHGAEIIARPAGKPIESGAIRPGLLADLVIVAENPLENFKVLYGTGTIRLNDQTAKVERAGGVIHVIKDGIVYDARRLLADVARMVAEARKKGEKGR